MSDLKNAEIAALEIYSTHYEASCHERFDGGIHFYYGKRQKPDTTAFFFDLKEVRVASIYPATKEAKCKPKQKK